MLWIADSHKDVRFVNSPTKGFNCSLGSFTRAEGDADDSVTLADSGCTVVVASNS